MDIAAFCGLHYFHLRDRPQRKKKWRHEKDGLSELYSDQISIIYPGMPSNARYTGVHFTAALLCMLTAHTGAHEYKFLSALFSDAGSGSGDGGKSPFLISLLLCVHTLSSTIWDSKRIRFAIQLLHYILFFVQLCL